MLSRAETITRVKQEARAAPESALDRIELVGEFRRTWPDSNLGAGKPLDEPAPTPGYALT